MYMCMFHADRAPMLFSPFGVSLPLDYMCLITKSSHGTGVIGKTWKQNWLHELTKMSEIDDDFDMAYDKKKWLQEVGR